MKYWKLSTSKNKAMNNSKNPNPDETAKKLQSMVSLGIPDTKFAPQTNENPLVAEAKEEKPDVSMTQPATVSVPASTRRKRKEQPEEYRENYFRRVDFADRQPLYITRSTHEKLMLIVNIIGGRKATISSYVENILLQHLESYREEINRLFDEHYLRNRNEL
jgi:hypothetical protein